jgi:hypothetical protein
MVDEVEMLNIRLRKRLVRAAPEPVKLWDGTLSPDR